MQKYCHAKNGHVKKTAESRRWHPLKALFQWWADRMFDLGWIKRAATWRMGSQDLDTWLITIMVIVSPQFLGLWDPFQMAFLWLINGGDPNHLQVLGWSSPPSRGCLSLELIITISRWKLGCNCSPGDLFFCPLKRLWFCFTYDLLPVGTKFHGHPNIWGKEVTF